MNRIRQIRKRILRRKERVRSRIFGTAKRPRFSVFRSNKFVYAQMIDDENGITIISASTREEDVKKPIQKTEAAVKLGEKIAVLSKEKGIQSALFDRGAYLYHGRIRQVVEAARKHGLKI